MSLAQVPLEQVVRVVGIRPGGQMGYRLMEMGLIEGAHVQVLRRAPLGDPLHVRLGDYELSLRSNEAELIDVALD
ncbi:MAG: ferrous iron transport protein A [Planctomycetota bacterium]